jgi:hypothetical protein
MEEVKDNNAKDALLAHYSTKTPNRFRQIDGFANWHNDTFNKDGDGYVVMSSETQELMRGASVRVLIPFETTQSDAAALLRKILGVVDQSDTQSRDCVLCSDGDIHNGGGVFWTDNRWICPTCWGRVADHFQQAGPRA